MIANCPVCGEDFEARTGDFNRAAARGYALRCSQRCVGMARRSGLTDDEKRANKAEYDREYRDRMGAELKRKKRDYYQRDRARQLRKMAARRADIYADPERAAAYRAKMAEYRADPEWREHKRRYDRRYRAKEFGEFADAYLALLELDDEIEGRMSRPDIRASNGTRNKKQSRRREWERSQN